MDDSSTERPPAYFYQTNNMAGSLNHIVDEDGAFRMGGIENMSDAHEALDECFKVIYHLSKGDKNKINAACRKFSLPKIKADLQLGGEDAL